MFINRDIPFIETKSGECIILTNFKFSGLASYKPWTYNKLSALAAY